MIANRQLFTNIQSRESLRLWPWLRWTDHGSLLCRNSCFFMEMMVTFEDLDRDRRSRSAFGADQHLYRIRNGFWQFQWIHVKHKSEFTTIWIHIGSHTTYLLFAPGILFILTSLMDSSRLKKVRLQMESVFCKKNLPLESKNLLLLIKNPPLQSVFYFYKNSINSIGNF